MEIDDALGSIYDPELVARKHAEAQAMYEERIVKKILTKAGLEDQIGILRNQVRQITGTARLTFAFFHEQYPSFPVWLSIRRISYVHETKIPDLFNKFTTLPIAAAWAIAVEEAPVNKPVALVFDYPGTKGAQLVCHNWDVDLELHETRICRRVGHGRGQLVWIERFEPFFAGISDIWQPAK